jgi:hypothetical protein
LLPLECLLQNNIPHLNGEDNLVILELGHGCVIASMRESLQNKGKASVGVIPLTGPNVEHKLNNVLQLNCPVTLIRKAAENGSSSTR